MKRNKQYDVLFIFYAFLQLRVRCKETCKSYHTDVGCEEISLQNGNVCYEWSIVKNFWQSSSATIVCFPSYKLNRVQKKNNCIKRTLCFGLELCYSWEDQAIPACVEEAPSAKSTSTFVEARVSVSPNATSTSTTNVTETDALETFAKEVSTEVVFRTFSHLDQTSVMKFTTKEEQTFSTNDNISLTGSDSTNTKVMYVTIPSVLGVIVVVLVVVVLICRKQCKREATKHREDYPLQSIPQQETFHSQTENINSTVVDTADPNATGSDINDAIYNNDKVNNKYVQNECLDDSYDHLGTRKPIVQDQTYSHTSQTYRPDMYCMSGIQREQFSGETYNTLNKDLLPTKSQGIYDLQTTNHLNVIKDDSGAEYSHAVQKKVTDLAKFHQTDDEQTVYLNVYPSS